MHLIHIFHLMQYFQDDLLRNVIEKIGTSSWAKISRKIPGKSEIKCHKRWLLLNRQDHIQKAGWTQAEDQKLRLVVSQIGANNWSQIAELLPGRISKQCRERWINNLDPALSKRPWTTEEDQKIIELHKNYGNKWALIAKQIPGRSDNSIKNRFNSNLKRQLTLGKVIPTYARTASILKQEQVDALRKRDLKITDKQNASDSESNSRMSSPVI